MERKRKLLLAKSAAILGAVPLLLWAHEYGPDVGYAGVPKEIGTCAAAGCHVGTAVNGGGGSVSVAFPNGLTYVPGVKQNLTVTITDSKQKAWGFELTARASSNSATMEGSFASVDANTALTCGNTSFDPNTELVFNFGQTQSCTSGFPLAYIEQSMAGYNATLNKVAGSGTYQFTWTPPSTNVGNIVIYVAGNAANADLTSNGDHIYTATYTLTPTTASNTPTITSVFNAAGFQNGVFPGSFISIKGSNLSPVAYADWNNSIVGSQLPQQVSGVSVNIGGKPAYVFAMAQLGGGSDQINVQTPDAGFGSMQVTVTTPAGTSAPFTVNSQEYGPAFWVWANNQPVATHADCSPAFKTGTYPASAFDPRCQTLRPAQPGETITLWGTGFGPLTPAVPAGQVPSAQLHQTNAITATVGGISAPAVGALSGFPGDYQINVTVPPSLADGDYPLSVTVNGASSPTMTLTVHH